jgi:hypothetical protein
LDVFVSITGGGLGMGYRVTKTARHRRCWRHRHPGACEQLQAKLSVLTATAGVRVRSKARFSGD